MAKRPKDRYASCQELADDLQRWLEGKPTLAERSEPVQPRKPRLGLMARTGWRRVLLGLVGAAAGVVILAVVGVAVVLLVEASRQRRAEARRLAEQAQQEEAQARHLIPYAIQGEYLGETPVRFAIAPGALRVIVPRGLRSPLFMRKGSA